MARYEKEFMGMPANFEGASGLDPNFGDYYRGMRMGSDGRRAAYGAHRLVRRQDLGTEGGFFGRFGGRPGGARDYDPRWERDGMVHDSAEDPGLLHHYNANSPRFAEPHGDEEAHRRAERNEKMLPEPAWMARRAYNPRYSNRGVSDAGYSEGWAHGPMRGAR